MVGLQEGTSGQWANVETSYQRRADLIPNLVSTVKGYANFEQETLTQVIEARSKATSIQIDADDINPAQLQKFQAAQDKLSGALSRLLVTVERYPDLKANQNFLDVQEELKSTENKIAFARQSYNDQTLFFNNKIQMFPSNIVAGMFTFNKEEFFELEDPSEKAVPKVAF